MSGYDNIGVYIYVCTRLYVFVNIFCRCDVIVFLQVHNVAAAD